MSVFERVLGECLARERALIESAVKRSASNRVTVLSAWLGVPFSDVRLMACRAEIAVVVDYPVPALYANEAVS